MPQYGSPTPAYLCASLKEKAFESWTATHQGLDAILGDLITPGDVELLQQGTALTDRRTFRKEIHFIRGRKKIMGEEEHGTEGGRI